MAITDEPTTINVEPHPRLLGVLGDIELAPWKCIAELVDNAFDEFLRQLTAGEAPAGGTPTVNVSLPAPNSSPRDGEVWVADNGPGMALAQLRSALRAGWSSNDRVGALGLYGVGFNIATARLGHTVVVKTARVEDPAWTVVTLDLRALARGDHFNLPVSTEPKTSSEDHGTTVIIRDLKPEHHENLSRRPKQRVVRDNLGDVYSYLLADRGFVLTVDRQPVQPRRPCLWGEDRYVVRNNERVPAVIHIDQALADRHVCLDCGTWQDDVDDGVCQSCQGHRLKAEPRRIRGWLGVQRYLHASDYGIDFIRNGRKILVRDTSMFEWQDPDDPGGRGEREYPVEVPGTGRIVGQIHIDHVRVNYQKSAFDYDTPDWKKVVQVIRGAGPLRPKVAAAAGYPVNNSPLAKLYSGYRRNDPGLAYLIPGDGKRALHERAREWAALFRDGDPLYQTDEQWYAAAQRADEPDPAPDDADTGGDGAHDGDNDVLRRKGLLDDEPGEDTPPAPSPAPTPLTEDQRREQWRAAGERLPDLEARFGLPGHGAALEVTAYSVRKHKLRRVGDEEPVPVYVASERGSKVEVFIDADHKVFTDFAVDTRDLVVMELAEYMRVRSGLTERSLSALFYDLKNKCLPDHKVTNVALAETAARLLEKVREGMEPVLAGSSAGYWSLLSTEDQAAAQQKYAMEGGTDSWDDDVLSTGGWVTYVPGMALVRLLNTRPEVFLDGRVFKSTHQGLSSPEARAMSVERVADLLGDVAVLADRPIRRGGEELQRGRLSCVLLERELVTLGEPGAGAADPGSEV